MFIEFGGSAINFLRVDIIELFDHDKEGWNQPYWIKVIIGDRDYTEWYESKKERDTRYKKLLSLVAGES